MLFRNKDIENRITRNTLSRLKLMAELSISLPGYFKMRNDPVVLLGMHRSGTTLLAKILTRFKVHMGHRNGKLNEANFFLDMNVMILELFHAFWDYPSNMNHFLDSNSDPSQKISDMIYRWINSYRFLKNYVGFANYKNFYDSDKMVWGWKDPRSTVTWPIWFKIFNSAKFIFIYRNGIDVAESLRKAERNSERLLGGRNSSLRATTLEGAFDIWEEYNSIYRSLTQKYSSANILECCYEDLLLNPWDKLSEILNFIELDVNKNVMKETVENIDASRRFSFAKNDELYGFYEKRRKNPLMKIFGYDNIEKQ